MSISLALVPALGACAVWAAPAPQWIGTQPTPNCQTTEDLKSLRVDKTEVADGKEDLQAWKCTSSPDANCALTETATYTYATSWSVGGGVDLKFKATPSFEVAPKFQFGYSWTHTEGKGASARVECPPGGLQCGLVATPDMCTITGKVNYNWVMGGSSLGCKFQPSKNSPFKITSICIDQSENSRNKQMNAIVDFKACLIRCRKEDKCDRKKAENLRLCPGIKKEDAFRDAPPAQEEKPNPNNNNNNNNNGNPCDKEPGEQKGSCKPEDVGRWNCVKGKSTQRCASGAWSGLTPMPAGVSCTCGYKGRDWNPATGG